MYRMSQKSEDSQYPEIQDQFVSPSFPRLTVHPLGSRGSSSPAAPESPQAIPPPPTNPSIITCIKHSHTRHPLLTRHILDPFPHIFQALTGWTPRSDSQQGPLQPIREVIHTLPHLSYLLYYHPDWPLPRSYPLRPGAQAGYPGFQ